MNKLFCYFLKSVGSKDEPFYIAYLASSFGYSLEVFVDKSYYDLLSSVLKEQGFVDVTDDFSLKYDKKLDKLVYFLNK